MGVGNIGATNFMFKKTLSTWFTYLLYSGIFKCNFAYFTL
jgi:hypothetical protein